jgi:hypothetical protein
MSQYNDIYLKKDLGKSGQLYKLWLQRVEKIRVLISNSKKVFLEYVNNTFQPEQTSHKYGESEVPWAQKVTWVKVAILRFYSNIQLTTLRKKIQYMYL